MTRLTRVTPPRARAPRGAPRPPGPAPRQTQSSALFSHECMSRVRRVRCGSFGYFLIWVKPYRRVELLISYLEGVVSCARRSSCRFTDSQHPRRARMDYGHMHSHAQCTHAHANTPSHGHTRTHKCVQAYAPSNSCLALTRCAAIPTLGDPTAYTALRSRIDQSGHYDGRRIRWSSGVLRSPRAALPPPSYVAAVAFGALARVCPLPTLSALALYCTGTDRVSPLISETAVLLGSV